MIDFFDRLDNYMKYKGLNDNKITVETGISNGLIGKARKKRGSLSQENISKILCCYSDLSADWLLTGRGDMLKTEIEGGSVSTKIVYKSDPRDAEILAANKETIETQRELISTLKQRISDLERSSSYSKTSGFHTVPSADTSNPSQTGAKAKRPNK